MKADLHIHSYYSSDGTYSPARLMELCHDAGIRVAALTDHNSARGVEEAQKRAEELGLCLIPGVELDCVCQGTALHLLGYGIDPDAEEIRRMEREVLKMEQDASAERIRLVKELGIYFDEADVWEHSWNRVVTAEMIAEAALKDDRNRENPMMRPFYPGESRGNNPYVNFYWDICSPGKPAFVPVEYQTFEQAQKLISDVGGISVIAHPGQTLGKNVALMSYMAERGVRGMEVYSSYHSPEQVFYYEETAASLGLFCTPGSDFHGKTKPSVSLGVMPGMGFDQDVPFLLEMLELG